MVMYTNGYIIHIILFTYPIPLYNAIFFSNQNGGCRIFKTHGTRNTMFDIVNHEKINKHVK